MNSILDNELVLKYFSPPLQHIDIEKKMYIALSCTPSHGGAD